MEVILQPVANPKARLWAIAIILLPVVLIPIPWWIRVLACIMPIFLAAISRVTTVDGDKFRTQLFIGSLPLKPVKCNLPGVLYIETKFNSTGSGIGAFLPFKPLRDLLSTLLDIMIPAIGGAYEIWLITAKGREIVAWQGYDQKCFEENVALLTARAGAEVRGRSK